MENVAGGGNLASSAVRPTTVPAEQKERGPQRASEVTQGESRSPTESVASLASAPPLLLLPPLPSPTSPPSPARPPSI